MSSNQTGLDFGVALNRIRIIVDLLRLSAMEAADEIAPLLHPDMRTYPAPGVAPGRPYETREEFLGYFADARTRGLLVEPDAVDIRTSPSGAVMVAGSLRLTNPDGVEVTPAWFVYTFRDELIASLKNYLDGDLAREAAGFPIEQAVGI